MHLIAAAAHDSGVALDNPFALLILVSSVAVTAAFLALVGGFALVVTGHAE
ncbi:hypothetical protein [Agrococcus sp. Ld7]|uniref:hypothetical protein n=1 Tax=Agrococcus sp. Ld7 TaxID=649148 RepID=UPI00386CAB83